MMRQKCKRGILIGAATVVLGSSLGFTQCDVGYHIETEPTTGKPEFGWNLNASITLNIDPSFGANRVSLVQTVFNSWAAAANANLTVTYTSSSTPVSGTNMYQFSPGSFSDPTQYGETTNPTLGIGNSGAYYYVIGATSVIDTKGGALTDPYFMYVVANEIGHTFGMDDNVGAEPTETPMALPNNMNEAGVVYAPSSCDIHVMSQNEYLNAKCPNSCDSPQCPGYVEQECQMGAPCNTDNDCPGGLTCVNHQCGCSSPCDDPACPGFFSSNNCGPGGNCKSDNDCPGGLVCINGTCGCGYVCDDTSCPGYQQQCSPACTPGNCANCIPPECTPPESWNPGLCACFQYPSPIIIDTDGSGFHLTSSSSGVVFDFFGDGKPLRIAWTAPGSTNGWLALDRNGNGVIDDATELFGNITPQPPSTDPNGFRALAVFDEPENGGNGDGIIDSRDAIWPKLLVWIDANHDGISQPSELHHLDDIGIHSISLLYRETRRVDAFGNQFRYRGFLNPDKGDAVDRVIYDVFLDATSPN